MPVRVSVFVCAHEFAQHIDKQPPATVLAEVCAAASLFTWQAQGSWEQLAAGLLALSVPEALQREKKKKEK